MLSSLSQTFLGKTLSVCVPVCVSQLRYVNEWVILYLPCHLQVKQIMEEAVTRKFVHEDSSHIVSFCGE